MMQYHRRFPFQSCQCLIQCLISIAGNLGPSGENSRRHIQNIAESRSIPPYQHRLRRHAAFAAESNQARQTLRIFRCSIHSPQHLTVLHHGIPRLTVYAVTEHIVQSEAYSLHQCHPHNQCQERLPGKVYRFVPGPPEQTAACPKCIRSREEQIIHILISIIIASQRSDQQNQKYHGRCCPLSFIL